MPPLIAFAGALGGLAVVRWAYRTAQRVNRELEEARLSRVAEASRSSDIPTLRQDPSPAPIGRASIDHERPVGRLLPMRRDAHVARSSSDNGESRYEEATKWPSRRMATVSRLVVRDAQDALRTMREDVRFGPSSP